MANEMTKSGWDSEARARSVACRRDAPLRQLGSGTVPLSSEGFIINKFLGFPLQPVHTHQESISIGRRLEAKPASLRGLAPLWHGANDPGRKSRFPAVGGGGMRVASPPPSHCADRLELYSFTAKPIHTRAPNTSL
ncbi:hypothetical protein PGT21_031956 [Puccinia graminis f. sp. tritici]|uniref:Uncharacterized protein n=1 Tax=Puccinia graminis f. sp. tritici TaxID=56615 RepID=A0A5B0MY42_PUCGR|nr:hypothetical protein PGT21_031956 [Puccinia graminis f. sp. tritici]KAA1081881.1 hypothetical protein PGTUg99_026240 [Puccinia graminis f. sp. tritici]